MSGYWSDWRWYLAFALLNGAVVLIPGPDRIFNHALNVLLQLCAVAWAFRAGIEWERSR
jgi:hypothetical protein